MAVTVVLTGTSQNITATNSSPNITVASTTGWVVGATIQGTGFAAGTVIKSFVANTSAVLSNNYTGTTGTVSVIVSSNTGTLTVTLAASGDTASPQTMISAGFGSLIGNQTLQIFGATKIILQIATGAVYDDTEWVYELGSSASLRFNESYGCGIWRSGWKLQGSTYVKAKGHTVNYNNFDNSYGAGGRSIFFNSGAPTGYVAGTTMPSVHWNDVGWYECSGSNAAAIPTMYYGSWSPVGLTSGRIIFDYAGDSAGANSGFGGSYGTIQSLLLYRCIGGVSTGVTSTALTTVGTFEYFSLPTGSGSSNPDIKMAFPNNVPFSGYAPIFYNTTPSNEYVACNTSANEILVDYVFPTGFNVLTNTENYSAGTRTYKRTVNFNINNSSGSALSGATLYIYSGSNVLVNAVQASGVFSTPLQSAYLSWVGRSGNAYITALSSTDTRAQTAQLRMYGYQQQSVSYSLQDSAYSQPFFMLADGALASISSATASALTGIAFTYASKSAALTASHTLDELYAWHSYTQAQTAQSAQANFMSWSGSMLTLASPWTLSNTATLAAGTNLTGITAAGGITTSTALNNLTVIGNVTQATPTNLTGLKLTGNLTFNTNTNTTITLSNCSISGTISNSGTGQISIINNGSTIGSLGLNIAPPIITATLTLSGLNGDSLYVTDSNGNQKAYVASSGSNYSLDVTGGTGVWSVKVAKYGFFSQSFTFTPANGGVFSFVPVLVSDPSISQASATLVGAYTTVNNPDQIYDLCALYETTNAGIAYPNMATKQNKFVLLAYGYVFASTGVVFSFANNIITLNCTSFSSGATFTSGLTTLGSANTGTATLNYPVLANGSNGENTWLTLSLTPGDEVYVSDNNGVTKDNVTASSSQYTFGAPAGSTGSWNYIIGQYGYTQQTGSFTPTGGLINQTITPVLDTSITTQNKTVVSSYTILDTAAKVYDYAALYATTPSGILEGSPVAISGITLNFGSKNVVIDANAALVYSYSGNTVTIKASILTAEIITNGTVTYLNGATVKGIVSDSTGYTGEVDISGLTGCSVAIVEDTGAIYSFNPNVTGNLSISIPSSYKGTWKAIVTKFAQKPVSVSFALQSGNPTAIAYVAIPDTGVIDSLSDVSAYSQLNSTQQMYDYFSYWNTTQQGIEFINSVSWSGSVLNCGNANILFDANASANASLNPLTLQVTIKTSSMSGDILTTGTVTRANGAVTTGLVTDSTGTTAIITFTGLSTNDAYYIENASGVMQSYGLATSGTFTSYLLPSQQSAGNWSWSLKRPGYAAQAGVISVLGGGRFNIQAVWAKMLQPDGSVMFDGAQEAAGLTVDFTGANNTPRIKVGNTSYTPRQVFDACEYALITQSGMKWLAEGNDGIQVASLSTGNFIFMSAGWRVMQSASTNVNSTINAFVISSDGYVVDGTNGPVAFLSATSALPTDKIIELDDIYAIVQTLPTLAQVMAQIERSNGMLAQVQTSVDAIGT